MMEVFTCPVDRCEWWAALSGYTEKVIRHVKRHVRNEHRELSMLDRRWDGGIVDSVIAEALTAQAEIAIEEEPDEGEAAYAEHQYT